MNEEQRTKQAQSLVDELGKLNQAAQPLAEDGTPYTSAMLVQLRAAADNATHDAAYRDQRDKERSKRRSPAPKAQKP